MTQNIGTDGQSHLGYCGLAEESSYGGGGSPTVYLPINSDSFSLENGVLYNSNIRGRARFDGTAGVLDDDGGVEMVAGPENGLGLLLKAVFGTSSVTLSSEGTGTDNVGTHTFTTDNKLPSLAVELGLGSLDAVRHLGVGIDSLEITHTPDDYLIVSTEMDAQQPDVQGSQQTPTYSDLRPFVWHDGAISLDGNDRSVDVAQFSASIENEIDEKIRGERYPTKAHVGTRTISGSLNLDFENIDALEMFLGGAAGSGTQTVQDSLYKASLNALWTSPELIVSGGTSGYSLELDFPNIILETHEAQVNEQDAIIENIDWGAEDTAGTYDVQGTLTNGQTAAY